MDPRVGPILGGVALLFTFAILVWWSRTKNKRWLQFLFVAWTLLTPVWFLADWYWFKRTTAEAFEEFKYSQELARNLWIAIVGLLGLLLKGSPSKPE